MITAFKKNGFLFLILLFAGGTVIGFAMFRKREPAKPVAAKEVLDTVVSNQIDTALLKVMSQVYSNLNLSKDEFLVIGKINAKNGVDTSDKLSNVDYVLSRKGTLFYFKLGRTETINSNGSCLYVDHRMKKVLLSAKKDIVPVGTMPDLAKILEQVKGEGFRLLDNKSGDLEKITLSNPYHLSCKEYSISFNPITLKPNQLHIRLSDFNDPENKQKDNVLDFYIKETTTNSQIDKYLSQNILRKANDKWVLTSAFQNYELINTL